MKNKKIITFLFLFLIYCLAHGQDDPNVKNQNGYLKSSGAVVHPHSLSKSNNTYKTSLSTKSNNNSLTGKPGKSDYSSLNKDYTKKKVTPTPSRRLPVTKHSKVYKLYAPKTNSQDPFAN